MEKWEYASLYLVKVKNQVRETRFFRDDKVTVENRLVAVIVRVKVDTIRTRVSSDIAAFNWAGQQGWRVSLDQASKPGPVPDFVSEAVRPEGEAVACRQFYLERALAG
jgi:hypothetical protein